MIWGPVVVSSDLEHCQVSHRKMLKLSLRHDDIIAHDHLDLTGIKWTSPLWREMSRNTVRPGVYNAIWETSCVIGNDNHFLMFVSPGNLCFSCFCAIRSTYLNQVWIPMKTSIFKTKIMYPAVFCQLDFKWKCLRLVYREHVTLCCRPPQSKSHQSIYEAFASPSHFVRMRNVKAQTQLYYLLWTQCFRRLSSVLDCMCSIKRHLMINYPKVEHTGIKQDSRQSEDNAKAMTNWGTHKSGWTDREKGYEAEGRRPEYWGHKIRAVWRSRLTDVNMLNDEF